MKAVLCKQYGPPESLVLEEVASPVPGPNQVVVAVHASAANFPDTLAIQGKFLSQFQRDFPFSPGGEAAGTIRQVGEGVRGFAVGDRVIANGGGGGFAEELLVDAANLIPLPHGIPMEVGASLVIAYGTTIHALRDRAQINPGETLLVLGAAGGCGLAAVELGKLMGARVIAAASNAEKLALCRQYGADETINYTGEDLRERIRQLTDGRGVDVVYDTVGGSYTEPALRSLAWYGRLLVIGFTAGDIPKPPLNLVLLKSSAILGVYYNHWSRREPQQYQADLQRLLQWIVEGRVKPRITSYPLEEAVAALRSVADRKSVGKVVVTTALGRRAS
jgi:NADPH2:quinone reductase